MNIVKYSVEPLIESFYIEESGKEKVSLKDYLRLKKAIIGKGQWIYLEYNGITRLCAINNGQFITSAKVDRPETG